MTTSRRSQTKTPSRREPDRDADLLAQYEEDLSDLGSSGSEDADVEAGGGNEEADEDSTDDSGA